MAGNKNSGRRTMEEELRRYKENLKRITLEELATSKVYNHLEKLDSKDEKGVKEIALPVYLKSKADKREHSGSVKVEQITGMKIVKEED